MASNSFDLDVFIETAVDLDLFIDKVLELNLQL